MDNHVFESENPINIANEPVILHEETRPMTQDQSVINPYTGRHPWFDIKGKLKQPYVVGLCGGSASGKTTVANSIIQRMNVPWVVILSLDSFYAVLSEEQHEAANRMEYDFDNPSAIESDLAYETLKKMKEGKTVKIPIYDFTSHTRVKEKELIVYGANVIIVEGLMTFHYEKLLSLIDLKIFVDTDSDLRLGRRIKRDMGERGRSLPSIMLQYTRFVKPNFDKYVSKLVANADIVIPWNKYNDSAVEMVSQLIKRNLTHRGLVLRSELVSNLNEAVDTSLNVHIIKQTNTVKVLSTQLRNRETTQGDFIIASKRLIKLCLIDALSMLFPENGHNDFPDKICAVSIVRAGEAFEESLRLLLYDYSVGRIVIQTNETTGEPEYHYLKLPHNISETSVLLFDASIASGAAAIMAIRILIDHEVNEENIIMVTLILTPTGVKAVNNAFPRVRLVTAVQDEELNKNYYIIPGMGNFGKRYYGS